MAQVLVSAHLNLAQGLMVAALRRPEGPEDTLSQETLMRVKNLAASNLLGAIDATLAQYGEAPLLLQVQSAVRSWAKHPFEAPRDEHLADIIELFPAKPRDP